MRVHIKPEAVRAIDRILAHRNLSREDFALQLGVTETHINRLLAGSRNPSPMLRRRMLRRLRLPFDTVFEILEEVEHGR